MTSAYRRGCPTVQPACVIGGSAADRGAQIDIAEAGVDHGIDVLGALQTGRIAIENGEDGPFLCVDLERAEKLRGASRGSWHRP